MINNEISINDNAKIIYDEIITIINKYRPKDIAPDDLCTNYYNDEALNPLLKELIVLLKPEPEKLDIVFSYLAPYLMELISPRVLIKLDKSYFNASGEFHKRVQKRIKCLLSNKERILSKYVSITTIYHFDRLIYLAKHFSPVDTYMVARTVCIAASLNSDYDDLVLRYAYEAILSCPNQDRAYLDLVRIYTKAVFDLDDLDVIKRSLDWLAKINKNDDASFYIGAAYFRFYMNHDAINHLDISKGIDKMLYEKFKETKDIAKDHEFYSYYMYYRAKLAKALKDKGMLYECYQGSYKIATSYKNKTNLTLFSRLNRLILEYFMENNPSYKDLDKIELTLDKNIRGSIKAELNAEFYMGDIDLVKNDTKLSLRVSDYFDSFDKRYVFFSFLYNDLSLGEILYESKTINGNIYFTYVSNEGTLVNAYNSIIG